VVAALGTSGPLVITEIAQIAQIERHPGTNPLRTVAAGVAFWVVVTAAVTVIGRWVRRNTQEHARAEALAEQAADQAARQAVGAERARIAQDLHDVVSHSLTLMTLQAAMAGRLLESNPVAAARALSGVAELGEQASTELHGLLGLWDDQEVARTGTGHDLIALVERARRAMPNLVLTVRGEPRALATEADEVAYRVVQEALTNAARFGDPAHAVAVTLEWAADAMGVTVDNRMRCGRQERAGAVGGGRGLVGMRQRVRRCGGEFLAQPSGDRRFVVTARLPTVSIPQARRGRTAQTRPASVPSLFS
jgi:signal transduction histidine kinase